MIFESVLLIIFFSIQSFIIVCEDQESSWCQVFEVANKQFVNLNKLQRPPSSDQLWYRKDEPDGSFVIVSVSDGRALKCDLESSQVVLCDASERDLWVIKGSLIVCKRTSQLVYADNNKSLYCGDEKEKSKDTTKSFKFQKVVCRCSNNCCHG